MLNKIAVIAVSLMLMTFVSFGKAVAEQAAAPAATGTQAQAKVEEVNATVEDPAAPIAPAAPAKPAAATSAFPTGLTPIVVGPLEITPSSAHLTLTRRGNMTDFNTVLILKIRNMSASDIKIMGFAKTMSGTDNKGSALFQYQPGYDAVTGTGILLSSAQIDKLIYALTSETNKLVTLSPGQFIAAEFRTAIFNGLGARQEDRDSKIYSTHRPKTASFNGTFGIVTIDGANELRSFSISDMPLTVTAQ